MPTLYDNFSQVRQYIDENNTSYVTKTELANASYASTSYVADYVAEHGGGEVTYSYLNDNYLPLSGGTITGDLTVSKNIIASEDLYAARQKADGPSYLWLGSNRPWKVWENNQEIAVTANTNNKNFTFAGYNATAGFYRVFTVNENETRANSKVTAWSQVVHEYPTYHKGVTYEYNTVYSYDIIPCETGTYTLGDSSYMYDATYTSNVWLGASQIYADDYAIDFKVNGNTAARIFSSSIRPWVDNGMTLGSSTTKWSSTYTSNIYADNAYISNYNNLIWTGTAVEYEALGDYTTYQFYLIQES